MEEKVYFSLDSRVLFGYPNKYQITGGKEFTGSFLPRLPATHNLTGIWR
jgi:hypothetical protein